MTNLYRVVESIKHLVICCEWVELIWFGSLLGFHMPSINHAPFPQWFQDKFLVKGRFIMSH